MRRSDDNEEALRQRLVAYHEQTKPLAAYYEHQGILHRVDAAKMPREVWGQIATILDQHEGRKA